MATDVIEQHLMFQNYLMNEKLNVTRNLRNKIFPTTCFEDYSIISVVGEGSFGQVVAAKNRHNKKIFAIKIIPKKNLVKDKRLMHLRCYVFIVLPYINGGHFFKLLRRVKKFDEDSAKFFAGQVVLAIEYLHYMGIIYRDLKPENLLLDLQGYLKIVDYGFAKHLANNYAYTFCGTPEYIAPEILLSKGYSLSSDWWTLGILLFEMCNGTPPFTSSNPLKLYEKILVGKINWPQHFSYDLKSIIQGLLQVDKSRRLGCMKKRAQDVKFHRWFSSLDWNALWNKKILPPFTMHKDYKNVEKKCSKIFNCSFTNCKNYIPSEMVGNIDFAI